MLAQAPSDIAAALREFARTEHARACADSARAYANCLAASVRCAEWLRARGIACGMIMFAASLEPFPEGSGRWPFCDPLECRHWTVRAGEWSIDWTARQFRPRADWPDVRPVDFLAAQWRTTADWACARCPELVAHPRHCELAPPLLERAHREIARATRGGGPFPDPRHDGTPDLPLALCACDAAASRAA
jgi:hypothetical protein